MSLNKDDIRAAVASGMISENQAVSLIALADARRGVRENMDGLDEPFELFKGFNEIFIVVGLSILYMGWLGLTGLNTLLVGPGSSAWSIYSAIAMGMSVFLSRYFTLKRRMVAPSIALTIIFGISALQLGMSLGWTLALDFPSRVAFAAGLATLSLIGHYALFRVPFSMALIGIGVFISSGSMLFLNGSSFPDVKDMFLLSAEGPFAILTIVLGLAGLCVALMFDMSDPHRVTRRSASGFWLHVLAAPAIVNTVALTLFESGTVSAQIGLLCFLIFMAVFAVAIDRRSFLVSGVGYVVALSIVVLEGQAAIAILLLGLGLVILGAQWEKLRRAVMRTLPNFPGKGRLPPWDLLNTKEVSA